MHLRGRMESDPPTIHSCQRILGAVYRHVRDTFCGCGRQSPARANQCCNDPHLHPAVKVPDPRLRAVQASASGGCRRGDCDPLWRDGSSGGRGARPGRTDHEPCVCQCRSRRDRRLGHLRGAGRAAPHRILRIVHASHVHDHRHALGRVPKRYTDFAALYTFAEIAEARGICPRFRCHEARVCFTDRHTTRTTHHRAGRGARLPRSLHHLLPRPRPARRPARVRRLSFDECGGRVCLEPCLGTPLTGWMVHCRCFAAALFVCSSDTLRRSYVRIMIYLSYLILSCSACCGPLPFALSPRGAATAQAMSPEKQWVPIGNLHDEEAWDDSALIRAYDGAIDAYQVSCQNLRPPSLAADLACTSAGAAWANSRRPREDGASSEAVRVLPCRAARASRTHSRLTDPSRLLAGAPLPWIARLVLEARG